MSEQTRVAIAKLPTGVPGLDDVLGGGLPEYSFNLIVGTPGAGKTTLAHQLMFALASPARPALYFTVLGEPPLKMLRYQQQMAYFDPAKVGASVHYSDLSEVVLTQDLERVFDDIVRQVEEAAPGIVVVDSFQTVAGLAGDTAPGALGLRSFVQRLAVRLTSVQATTFLAEHPDVEALLAEQQERNEQASRHEAARARVQRFQDMVASAEAALRQQNIAGAASLFADCLIYYRELGDEHALQFVQTRLDELMYDPSSRTIN